MSFLAPLFLAGALAVIGPIIFHLIRRTTREVTPFSSLMFLQPTPPRVTRRSRLENLWLLFLRCLVILLLALGFARPFLRTQASSAAQGSGATRQTVLLLDTSASMQRENLWDQARSKAEEILGKSKPEDEIAVLTFNRGAQTLVSFEDWRTMNVNERAPAARQRLAGVAPSWAGTHLDAALLDAAELLERPAEERPREREIVLISDLQEGSRLDGLQGYEWPRGITVRPEPVRAEHAENASPHWVAEADETEALQAESAPRLRVSNAAESKREQFELRWNEDAGTATSTPAKLDVYVPIGQSRIVRPPKPPSVQAVSLTLVGDAVEFDNTVFVLPPQTIEVPLLFIGQEKETDPQGLLYYLQRAFPKTRQQNVQIVTHRDDGPVPAFQLEQAQMLVLGERVSEPALVSARQFAREGKMIVAPLVTASSAINVAKVLDVPQFPASEATVKDYALLAQIDFQHPIFTPFADPRYSDFTKIHFWKYRKTDPAPLPGARVLARFDRGDSAIVQAPLGKGSVMIFASSWRPADSQLALSSKFVPLLHAMLEQSSQMPTHRAQYFVGDEVPLPPGSQSLTVRKPDGSEVSAQPGSKFNGADQLGIYTITPGALRFAVNLAPEESRTSPLAADRLGTLGVPLSKSHDATPAASAQSQARAQAAELEKRQKLWRWLIIAALAVLLLEIVIAGKLSAALRRSMTAQT